MDRKALIREYKQTPRPAGIYRVRNTHSGKALVGASVDTRAMLNRQRAQLRMGMHPNRELQRDWETEGAEAFEFEVLDLLEPKDDPGYDPRADLKMLEELWLEKLGSEGASEY